MTGRNVRPARDLRADPSRNAGPENSPGPGRPARRGSGSTASLNVEVPAAVRVYNALLGGKDNFALDRLAADKILAAYPAAHDAARANRDFHRRIVRLLAEQGIDQFLDIGCGMPTDRYETHQVAQAINPACRTVYVDNDPLVIVHARALLTAPTGAGTVTVVDADLNDPETLLADRELHAGIDLNRPIAVLLLTVLDHLTYRAARTAIRHLNAATVPGSRLAVSHTSGDLIPDADGTFAGLGTAAVQGDALIEPLVALESMTAELGVRARRGTSIANLLHGLHLEPSGTEGVELVPVNRWRPDPQDHQPAGGNVSIYGALARIGTHPAGSGPSVPGRRSRRAAGADDAA